MRYNNLIVVMGIFLIVLFNSIVYGALNTDMFIDGEAYVRVDRDIRITGIKVIEQINGAYETYNSDYSKDTTSIQVTLPNSDSFIVYEVTITNKGDKNYVLSELIEESYLNNNIKYEFINLEEGIVINGRTTFTFKIKVTTTYNDISNSGSIVSKYIFEELKETEWTFDYTGVEQVFDVPYNGTYKVELWGASGAVRGGYVGGSGAYTSGEIKLGKDVVLSMYVGEVGADWSVNRSFGVYSFNGATGGSYTCYSYSGGTSAYNYYGGSATDVRLVGGSWDNSSSLNSRIMVAAGGGSGSGYSAGGAGGGLIGYGTTAATGANQTEGGGPSKGQFGKGGTPVNLSSVCNNTDRYGSGSGYYGGGVNNQSGYNVAGQYGGSGGSSFISGHTGCVAIISEQDQTPKSGCATGTSDNNCSIHYSEKIFTNTKMIDGNGYNWTNVKGELVEMPTYDGTGTMVGNVGNGYAKITLVIK